MDYRIIIETEKSGKKWYFVQRRLLLFFWLYAREVRDISMYAYKMCWETLEEADEYIQADVNYRYAQSQKKIVKKEVLFRH